VKRVRKGVSTTLGLAAAAPFAVDRADAFAREVEMTRGDLGRFAYLLVGSSSGADDLLAEAYARAWPHYRRGEIDNLPGYLRRSMTNLANGRLRRLRLERREVATRRIDWRVPRTDAPESGFERHVDAQDELWRAIWQLPTEQRAVIILRHAEDRSEEETAELLGISLGTVKSRLSRGLATLRARLERNNTERRPGGRR
jgi:RNA polymerase sigma-70 factor (sigma-E family)